MDELTRNLPIGDLGLNELFFALGFFFFFFFLVMYQLLFRNNLFEATPAD